MGCLHLSPQSSWRYAKEGTERLKSQKWWMTPKELFSLHNRTDSLINSERHAQAQAIEGSKSREWNRYMTPFLRKKLCVIDTYWQWEINFLNVVSPGISRRVEARPHFQEQLTNTKSNSLGFLWSFCFICFVWPFSLFYLFACFSFNC